MFDSWTLTEWTCFDSRCFMIMWEFWPNSLPVIRCLIEGMKGENQTLEKLELNLIWHYLRKSERLDDLMITLMYLDLIFNYRKLEKNSIKLIYYVLKGNSNCRCYRSTVYSVKVKESN